MQAHLWLMDTVGGQVEYDVHAQLPGSTYIKTFTGAIDARCPQTANYSVLRCTGHQHIGAAGLLRGACCAGLRHELGWEHAGLRPLSRPAALCAGGICMEMLDADRGTLICSSCAEYGNSSSVGALFLPNCTFCSL
jgi:hypothetical protein